MSYARGKNSRAICERCGDEIPYVILKTEWTGARVCPDCFDYKHPQLTTHLIRDYQALKNPRKNADDREDAAPRICRNDTFQLYALVGDIEVAIS